MPLLIFKLFLALFFIPLSIVLAQKKQPEVIVNADFYRDIKSIIAASYVEEVNEEEFIYNSLNGGLQGMDPHSSYFSPQEYAKFKESINGEFAGIGVQIISENGFIKIISPIDDSPAFKAGIKAEDYITHVDGENMYKLSVEEASSKIKGKAGTKVKLVLVRQNAKEPIEMTLTRENIKNKSVSSKLVEDILIVRISSFIYTTSSEFKEEIEKHKFKGLILDIRNNPGGILDEAVAISDFLLNSEEEIVTIKTKIESDKKENVTKKEINISCQKNDKNCKKIFITKTPNETTFIATKNALLEENIPIIVIINKASASASEIVAAALQENKRAFLIGDRSFGKGVVQNIIPILNGEKGAIKITTARYYSPKRNPIQAIGVTPDLIIPNGKFEIVENKWSDLFFTREEDLKNHTASEALKEEAKKSEKYVKESIINEYSNDFQMLNAIMILKSRIQ